MENLLLVFGEPDRPLTQVKARARQQADLNQEVGKGVITAPPADYYGFRQDIMAKYPSHNPQKPLLVFKVATNSFPPSSAINTVTGRRGGTGDMLLGRTGGGENLCPS